MPTLVINTAEGELQLVLARGETRLEEAASLDISAPSRGVETLAPALRGMLEEQGIRARAIRRVACVRGPGSFTGLRLGLASACGLSRGCGALLAGLDYLPLLASTARENAGCGEDEALWCLLHARRGQVILQGFRSDLTPLAPPRAVSVARAAAVIAASDAGGVLLGSGLERNREAFAALENRFRLFLFPGGRPLLSRKALLDAAATAPYSADPIAPFYLRACDAEENLADIARRLGRDPEQSLRDLAALTH